jgi:hypothetical protein
LRLGKNIPKIHLGELMTLCSVKFDETLEGQNILKGRIVHRRDIGKDQYGAAAVYQDIFAISANPTTVQGLNNCIAYGLIPETQSPLQTP